ncbi:MAG: NAD-dependent epimerase/dehydratase family protein [Verrucomicrobiota bacterium]|nr:NAD-dependent epimerase/dehydratase family protein [Verrucomicrobiota bacterium]
MTEKHSNCVTGGTGYIGRRLIPLLTQRGHVVKAVVRAGSENKLPNDVSAVIADPLEEDSYTEKNEMPNGGIAPRLQRVTMRAKQS